MIRLRSREPRPYVFFDDPAIDSKSAAYNWDKFKRTGDLAHLPVKEGETLTVWTVRGLSREQWQRLVLPVPETDRPFVCLRYGLVNVSGLVDDAGNEVHIATEPSNLGDRLTVESWNLLGAYMDITGDVGRHIGDLSTVISDPT